MSTACPVAGLKQLQTSPSKDCRGQKLLITSSLDNSVEIALLGCFLEAVVKEPLLDQGSADAAMP